MKGTRLSIALLMVMAAVWALPTMAEAKAFAGTGELHAVGKGQIWVHGRGKVKFRVYGECVLVVGNRHANKIVARGQGQRREVGSAVIFTGYKGVVTVEGPSVAAHFRGGRVRFDARGTGWAILKGKGRWWTRHHSGGWNNGGKNVTFAAATEAADTNTTVAAARLRALKKRLDLNADGLVDRKERILAARRRAAQSAAQSASE
jgi:hypothetical protein